MKQFCKLLFHKYHNIPSKHMPFTKNSNARIVSSGANAAIFSQWDNVYLDFKCISKDFFKATIHSHAEYFYGTSA